MNDFKISYNYNYSSVNNYLGINHQYNYPITFKYNNSSVNQYLYTNNRNINNKPGFNSKFLYRKVGRDLVYFILGNDKAPMWDVNYIKNSIKQYTFSLQKEYIYVCR